MISNDTRKQLILEDIDPLECNEFLVKKREGHSEAFDASLIQKAIEKAFKAEEGINDKTALTPEFQEICALLTEQVLKEVIARAVKGGELEIELIQDAVENRLMDAGYYKVARRYIVYREERKRSRLLKGEEEKETESNLQVRSPDGSAEPLDPQKIRRTLVKACTGFEASCNANALTENVLELMFDGISPEEIEKAILMACRDAIEEEPTYGYVAARLLLKKIYREAWQRSTASYEFDRVYRSEFATFIQNGIDHKLLTPALLDFDLDILSEALRVERDSQFNYLGARTIYEEYLLQVAGRRIETPQFLWMRVAMGLCLNEEQKTERAIECYEALSSFRFVPSTILLLNAGTTNPQLSASYQHSIADNLTDIFKTIGLNAELNDQAAARVNDWTHVRAKGAPLSGSRKAPGIIPYLKVANEASIASNLNNDAAESVCAYLEPWHLDVEDFLNLQPKPNEATQQFKMSTALWIPDLFMQRVKENGLWTLFSPNDVPELHSLYGKSFNKAYEAAELKAVAGEISLSKQVEAMSLWRNILTALLETGYPWINFKDAANLRSPQQHEGVIQSASPNTEALINATASGSAASFQGAVNLVAHLDELGQIDQALLKGTVSIALRTLDNAIDINSYPNPETENTSQQHRPVGLGLAGLQDCLTISGLSYESEAAVLYADTICEQLSLYALSASATLAQERGKYESFEGSLWSQGILPIDSIKLLETSRETTLNLDPQSKLDWLPVRKAIRASGLRNSSCLAIAPTHEVSRLIHVSPSTEPYETLLETVATKNETYLRSNPFLVAELKKLKLWDEEMMADLKYYKGSIQKIKRIPTPLKERYKCNVEIDPLWLINSASRRQKWIDMGQALTLYTTGADLRALSDLYMRAWEVGLKTTQGVYIQESKEKYGALAAPLNRHDQNRAGNDNSRLAPFTRNN